MRCNKKYTHKTSNFLQSDTMRSAMHLISSLELLNRKLITSLQRYIEIARKRNRFMTKYNGNPRYISTASSVNLTKR